MNTFFSDRTSHLAERAKPALVIALVTILCLLAASMAAAGVQSGMQFTGGGFGPTREAAVRQATEDAENSASAYQLFTCVMVGEPSIFPGPNPKLHRNFSAEVTLECTP